MLDKCKVCKVTHGDKICAFEHNGDTKECPIPNDYITLKEHDSVIRRQTNEELINEILGRLSKVALKSYTPNLISMDEVRIVLEQIKGEE